MLVDGGALDGGVVDGVLLDGEKNGRVEKRVCGHAFMPNGRVQEGSRELNGVAKP